MKYDSDLAAVIDAWDRLPEAVRDGLGAMVKRISVLRSGFPLDHEARNNEREHSVSRVTHGMRVPVNGDENL
ncbi:MAG: hypothetical protein ACLQVF_27875 [Isosphaeraceae bacterium]